MRNRRFPTDAMGGGGEQTAARTDPQLMKEKSLSRGIKRHADDKANEITRAEKTHTHTHIYSLQSVDPGV